MYGRGMHTYILKGLTADAADPDDSLSETLHGGPLWGALGGSPGTSLGPPWRFVGFAGGFSWASLVSLVAARYKARGTWTSDLLHRLALRLRASRMLHACLGSD